MKVHGLIKDIKTFKAITEERNSKMESASSKTYNRDAIRDLANALHPENLQLVIDDVIENTPTTRTYRLRPSNKDSRLPPFRAGQYISINYKNDGCKISRPYSLSSSPCITKKFNYYDITIRKKEDGFLSPLVFKNWEKGKSIEATGPHGNFVHNEIRDTRKIVGIAGGSGITPLKSMAEEIAAGNLDLSLTLLYGSRNPGDIIFFKELNELENKAPDKLKIIYICSEPDEKWKGDTGFITADCIKKYVDTPAKNTFFICGPQIMYNFLDDVLKELDIPGKRIRREVFGEASKIELQPGFPSACSNKEFEITVYTGEFRRIIKAKTNKTILSSLECAGIAHNSKCRSGECGFCRSRLISGKVFVNPENDGRRTADKKFGYFHPCSSYPLTDLVIKIPVNKNT